MAGQREGFLLHAVKRAESSPPPHSEYLPHPQQSKKEKEYSKEEPEATMTITKKKITLSTEVGCSNKESQYWTTGERGGSFIAKAN